MGRNVVPRLGLLHLFALHELDHFAVRSGDERDPHFDQRILARSNHARFDTGLRAGGHGSGVGRVGIHDLQAEMQQRALGAFVVWLAPASLGGDLGQDAAAVGRVVQADHQAVGLQGANVTVLNGSDGLGEIAAGLVSQGLTILESVRRGVGVPPTDGSGQSGPNAIGNGKSPNA